MILPGGITGGPRFFLRYVFPAIIIVGIVLAIGIAITSGGVVTAQEETVQFEYKVLAQFNQRLLIEFEITGGTCVAWYAPEADFFSTASLDIKHCISNFNQAP